MAWLYLPAHTARPDRMVARPVAHAVWWLRRLGAMLLVVLLLLAWLTACALSVWMAGSVG